MTSREIKIEVSIRSKLGRVQRLIFAFVSIALNLTLLPSAIAQTPRKVTSVVSVKPSNVLREVSERATQTPALTAVELAAYGNGLIAKNGFDYRFDLCDILNHRRDQTHSAAAAEIVHNYQMTSTVGRKLTFTFTIANPMKRCVVNVGLRFPVFKLQVRKWL